MAIPRNVSGRGPLQTSVIPTAITTPLERAGHRQFLVQVAHTAWQAGGGRGEPPHELTVEIDRLVADRGRTCCDITRIPRHELRAVVEFAAANRVGALARRATQLAVNAAGGRASAFGVAATELGIALQMLEDLRTTTGAEIARAELWELRPSWAWVWMSESADAASWVRGGRWAQQIAARRTDPAPLARWLGQFANRRGAAEARARHDAALAAIQAAIHRDHGGVMGASATRFGTQSSPAEQPRARRHSHGTK